MIEKTYTLNNVNFQAVFNKTYFKNVSEAFNTIANEMALVHDFTDLRTESIIQSFNIVVDEQGYKYTSKNVFKFDRDLMSIFELKSSDEEIVEYEEKEEGLVVYLVLKLKDLDIYFTSNYTFTEDHNGNLTIYYFD